MRIQTDGGKRGTWSGAVENSNKSYCVTFCWNNAGYKGNIELIGRGVVPVDTDWDGDVSKYEIKKNNSNKNFYAAALKIY